MQQTHRWKILPPHEAAGRLADGLKTSPLIGQILACRGVCDPDVGRAFLAPSLKNLFEPTAIPNLGVAAQRVAAAIRAGERIVVYGDYDVDGITAVSILWHAIRVLGGDVDYYIPHRMDEGYGLNSAAIGEICDGGAKLIISVDCGVTAIEEAKVACQRGVDLIITDHHEWRHADDGRPMLPECLTVVHPRLQLSDGATPYPNPHLCGAGVAFKLAWGVGLAMNNANRVSEEFKRYLVEATALAALGTIADVVPLVGENRLLAHFGLGGLKRSELTGIKALIESAGLTGKKLDSYDVGFMLAPRLNACGRMGHAREAVEMLTKATLPEAVRIATELEQHNKKRQALERQIFEQAMEQVEKNNWQADDCRGVVLAADGWHAGVIGIVASRVVGKINRPVVMLALNDGHGHGSARSIPGFHLARALDACRAHLETCGGHEMAAGCRVETPKVPAFREAFRAHANERVTREMLVPELTIDAVAELRQINEALVNDLQRIGPFGQANPRPRLCCLGLEVVGTPRRVGKNADHAQLTVRQGTHTMKCIAFGKGHICDELHNGAKVDLAVEPLINEYNGYRTVELEVRDARTPGAGGMGGRTKFE